jgi:hypothetical protein
MGVEQFALIMTGKLHWLAGFGIGSGRVEVLEWVKDARELLKDLQKEHPKEGES